MKILFLTNQYYPLKTANELCIQNIINCFAELKCFVICSSRKDEVIHQKNLTIFSVKNVIKQKISNIFLYFIREIPFRFLSLIYRPVIRRKTVYKYLAKAEEIINRNKPDIVFSILNPIESVEVGYILKRKHPKLKFIIYDIDTLSNCNYGILEWFHFLKKMYLKFVNKYENKVFSEADLIIHLNCHKKHYLDSFYNNYRKKTLFLGIPVLNINKKYKKNSNKDFIYAGRFYGLLRDPKILIDIFENILRLNINKFDIYTNDEYVKNINKLLADKDIDIRNRFIVHNYVAQEKLDTIMENIGFLVSLGNSYTDMFPSKIISYIGSLKPIIHIYQTQDDPVIDFLKKYPDALLIYSKDKPEFNADKINHFINSERPMIEAEYIKEVYKDNLPEYNAKEIMNFIKKLG